MKLGTCVMALAAAAFLVAGSGCADSKLTAQRDSLLTQNKELEAKLGQESQARQLAESQLASREALPPTAAPSDMLPPAIVGDVPHKGAPAKAGTAAGPAKGTTVVKAAIPHQSTVGSPVLFASGKTTLDAAATKTLDSVAATIKSKYAGDKLVLEGFTDSTPPSKTSIWKSNEDLAKARATSVKNYLVKKGIKSADITIKAMGPTGDGKESASSRRVEVTVLAAK
jgi:outer membrane protein OmpA-like peptidoglycan-associated protein